MKSNHLVLAIAALTTAAMAQADQTASTPTTTAQPTTPMRLAQSDERERNSSRAPIVEPTDEPVSASSKAKAAHPMQRSSSDGRDMNSSRAPIVDPSNTRMSAAHGTGTQMAPSYPVDGPSGATSSRRPIVGK